MTETNKCELCSHDMSNYLLWCAKAACPYRYKFERRYRCHLCDEESEHICLHLMKSHNCKLDFLLDLIDTNVKAYDSLYEKIEIKGK